MITKEKQENILKFCEEFMYLVSEFFNKNKLGAKVEISVLINFLSYYAAFLDLDDEDFSSLLKLMAKDFQDYKISIKEKESNDNHTHTQ